MNPPPGPLPPLAVLPSACPCASGLPAAKCCALDVATLAPPQTHQPLLPKVDQAIAAHSRGAHAEAERLCLDVLELAPGQGGALAVLFHIRRVQGRHMAAQALLGRLVALQPNNVWATQELALLLFGRGDLAAAEHHARNCVRIAPADPQSHNLMGMILTEGNQPQIGEYHYRRVLELTGERNPIVLANLAWNLKNQGKIDESRALYQESMARDASILQTVLGYARMEETDRNFSRADELLDQAERLAPDNPNVLLQRAVIRGRTKAYDQALTILDRLGEKAGLGANELLEKGRLLDRMGRFDAAFETFTAGKQLARERTGVSYLADHATDLVARLKAFFTAPRLQIIPRAQPVTAGPQPLFIIGFPRSGTTMVEQTLTAHSRISAGDELPFIADITAMMPRMLNSPTTYPEALADLWMGDQREGLDNLRDYYLQRVRQLGIIEPDATWFTDKMPLNETHLGLIGLMFPAAPIVHVLRHPLDVVLSVFSNQLTHGFNCASDLETIARHYVLIADLIAHYRSEMTLRYLPVRYEDIVDDQETHIRRLLEFIGLPFEPGCLNFHENKRYARTASYAQVTEKLYDRSRYRYRCYLKHLAPVIPILEPVIERLGYRIER